MSIKILVTLTNIFKLDFFLPPKITFRGLFNELCNDICTNNTSNNSRKHYEISENVCFLKVLARIIKQVDFFHKKCCFFANARKMAPIIVIIFSTSTLMQNRRIINIFLKSYRIDNLNKYFFTSQ